ncbi:MAG: hypothetical protein NW226_11630 [Microscillaceae bacterium]|nr:hypothetical protein [Microscillaceae bacterium]
MDVKSKTLGIRNGKHLVDKKFKDENTIHLLSNDTKRKFVPKIFFGEANQGQKPFSETLEGKIRVKKPSPKPWRAKSEPKILLQQFGGQSQDQKSFSKKLEGKVRD